MTPKALQKSFVFPILAMTALAACTVPTGRSVTVDGMSYAIDRAPGSGALTMYYLGRPVPCDGTASGCEAALRQAKVVYDQELMDERQLDDG